MQNTPSIQAIDKKSVHQICSGQVVLDLATAVKELIENSLDAGATNIEIKTKEYGKEIIEVSDNGTGIEEKDFESLALKHYTSKIREFDDLMLVDTFGFRGEALSSLSALSNVIITTQHKSNDVGSKLEFDHNGRLINKSCIARGNGTTVTVADIFYTLPVRYKEFHRNFKKEFAKLVNVVYSYSLVNCGIRFNFVNIVTNKKHLLLSTNGKKNVLDIISGIFGPTQTKNLVKITQHNLTEASSEEYNIPFHLLKDFADQFILTGYVSKVEHGCGRSAPDRQFFFINNRPCDYPKLSRIINEIYHMFNRNQYPFVLLDVSLNKKLVDVNVTPDKRLIMIQQEKLLFGLIRNSLKLMFESCATYYCENVGHSPAPIPSTSTPLIKQPEIIPKENDLRYVPSSLPHTEDKNAVHEGLFPVSKKVMQTKHSHFDQFRSDYSSSKNVHPTMSRSIEKRKDQQKIKNFFTVNDKKRKIDDSQQNKDMPIAVDSNKRICHSSVSSCKSSSEPFATSLHKESNNEDYLSNPESLKEDDNVRLGSKLPKRIHSKENVSGNINDEPESLGFSKLSDTNENELVITGVNHNHSLVDRKHISVSFDMESLKRRSEEHNAYMLQKRTSVELTSFHAKIAPTDNKAAEKELEKHVSKEMFLKMTVIGQFNLGFIITRLDNDLFIVDQHATDEKYNFETLQTKHCLKGQKLIRPLPMELTSVNKNILVDNLEIMRKNGFDFEISNEGLTPDSTITLTKVPSSRNWTFGVSDVEELIFMLSDAPGVMCRPSRVRQMFASRACRTSVMVGTALDFQTMRKLIFHMSEINHPWNCPHGRPTMRHLINLLRISD